MFEGSRTMRDFTPLFYRLMCSKGAIRFKGRVYERTRKYVSILKRIATQPSDTRWGLNTNFIVYQGRGSFTIFPSLNVFCQLLSLQILFETPGRM